MTRIHFRFDDNNLHVKENVYMYTTKFLTRLLNKQTYLNHIKNTINACYDARREQIKGTMYVDENVIFKYKEMVSVGYFCKYLRHVVNTYPDFLKARKFNGIWHYYAPYKILNIYTSETPTTCFQPNSVNEISISNESKKEKDVKSPTLTITPYFEEYKMETDELALLNSSYMLVKEFDNKRKEKFIDCDEWQNFKSNVIAYFNKKK